VFQPKMLMPFIALALSLWCGRPAAAQDMAVSVEVQVPLLVKILGFDRNLTGRPDNEIVLGVLYQGKYRTSANVATEVREALKRSPPFVVGGRKLRTVAIDLDATPDLDATLARLKASVLYVTPLRAADVRALAAATRASHVTTVTGVPEYVEMGLAVGIGIAGQRPEIVVNLAASRAEGADYDAQLLKLARIVP
jgi:hypothetical protein